MAGTPGAFSFFPVENMRRNAEFISLLKQGKDYPKLAANGLWMFDSSRFLEAEEVRTLSCRSVKRPALRLDDNRP